MRFWADWAMWEKLCLVLAGVLTVVFLYSFGVLLHKRRKMKKFEAAIETEKSTHPIEEHPMLHCSPEVPFGARALERGVQIEGIWVSSSETVDQIPKEFTRQDLYPNRPMTPMTGSPLKMMDTNNSNDDSSSADAYPRYPSASHATGPSKAVDGNTTSDDGNMSGGSNAPRASQQSYRTVATYPDIQQPAQEPGQRQSTQWLGPRSSWITRPMSYKRWSGVSQDGHRQSTEEFRRRFSKLFDEQLQVPAIDNIQLHTVPPIAEANERPHRPYYRSA